MENRVKWIGMIVGIWVIIGIIIASKGALFNLSEGYPSNWIPQMYFQLSSSLTWALFTLPILWLLEKRLTNLKLRFSFLLFLLFIGLFFSLIHRYVSLWIDLSLRSIFGKSGMDQVAIFQQLFERDRINILVFLDAFLIYSLVLVILILTIFYLRSRAHEVRMAETEKLLAIGELENLKSQLYPHFLFNALNSISSLINSNKDAAINAIANLATLLRTTIERRNQPLIPLENELNFARQYMLIQQGRFKDRLKIVFDISKAALKIPVPPFTLQLLLENAIKHNLELRGGRLTIEVFGNLKNNNLSLTVRDHSKDPVVRKSKPIQTDVKNGGLGIKNLMARMEKIFGDSYSCNFIKLNDFSYEVSLIIPVQNE